MISPEILQYLLVVISLIINSYLLSYKGTAEVKTKETDKRIEKLERGLK